MAKRLILMIEVKEVLYRWTQGMGKKTIARCEKHWESILLIFTKFLLNLVHFTTCAKSY